MGLPIYRVQTVARGQIYICPKGSVAWNIKNGEDASLPPGIYIHTDDERTDEEIRATISKLDPGKASA